MHAVDRRRACATSAPPICWSIAAIRKRSLTRSRTRRAQAVLCPGAGARARRIRFRPTLASCACRCGPVCAGAARAISVDSSRAFVCSKSAVATPATRRGDRSDRGRRDRARRCRSNGASRRRSVDFFDVKADVEALLALHRAPRTNFASSPKRIRRCIPDSRRESGAASAPSAGLARFIPSTQRRLDLTYPVVRVRAGDRRRASRRDIPEFREISRYPAIRRDIAVIVDEAVTVRGFARRGAGERRRAAATT